MRYIGSMKQVSDMADKVEAEGAGAERGHDAWVRAKVAEGLEQSCDRSAMIPIERVLRDLTA